MMQIYEGDDFDEWLSHFRLEKARLILVGDEIGVSSLMDLVLVYEDESFLQLIDKALTKLEFKRFINASAYTKAFRGQLNQATEMGLQAQIARIGREIDSYDNQSNVNKLKRQLEDMQSVLSSKKLASLSRKKDADDLNRKIISTEERKALIKALENHLAEAASLDLCFMVDCTGSMISYMQSIRDRINELVNSIDQLYPDVPLRLGFVGYRDHCDGSDRSFLYPFSSDIAAFKMAVGSQKAFGGCGSFADVYGGLHTVTTNLTWRSATRILMHMGDEPGHGLRINDCSGIYPNGDPTGLEAEGLLQAITDLSIVYIFGRIQRSTDKMISVFNSIKGPDFVTTIDVNDPSNMMTKVASSVTASLTSSISSSVTTAGKGPSRNVILDNTPPNWGSLKSERIHKFSMADTSTTTIQDVIDADDGDSLVKIPELIEVKVAKLPFAKGVCQVAYKAQHLNSRRFTEVVHKETLFSLPEDLTREKYENRCLSVQWAARCFANAFAKVVPASYPSIDFAPIALIRYLERPGAPLCTQEAHLPGLFTKFNSNSGLVVPNPTAGGVNHDVVQAFSHWTFHISKKHMMVVDCQGVFDAAKKCFRMTDPAIHCTNVLRYGGTNLSTQGMERFFKTHRCNGCCAALGLPPA